MVTSSVKRFLSSRFMTIGPLLDCGGGGGSGSTRLMTSSPSAGGGGPSSWMGLPGFLRFPGSWAAILEVLSFFLCPRIGGGGGGGRRCCRRKPSLCSAAAAVAAARAFLGSSCSEERGDSMSIQFTVDPICYLLFLEMTNSKNAPFFSGGFFLMRSKITPAHLSEIEIVK